MASADHTRVFEEIARCAEEERHLEALELANQVLEQTSGDEDAQRVKGTALLKLGRGEEALPLLPPQAHLPRAYALYRSNMLEKSLEVIRSQATSFPLQVLEAQVLYKMERFEESAKILEKLTAEHRNSDFGTELMANYVAASSAALTRKIDIGDKKLRETYDLAFNAAHFCIGQDDLTSAESFLKLAENLCKDHFSGEQGSDGSLDRELAHIEVQIGYVKQLQGKKEEALELYERVLKHRDVDEAVQAVASNNVVSIHQSDELQDSISKIKIAMDGGLGRKLQRAQRRLVAFNHALLLFHSLRLQQCREELDVLIREEPGFDLPLLLLAALTVKEKKDLASIPQLKDFSSLIQKYESSLPSLPSVNVESLEALIPKLTYKSFKSLFGKDDQPAEQAAGEGEKSRKPKAKKKKKKPVPKDTSKPVDPERWIPLKHRSYYKAKGKKAGSKKDMGKGASQGAALAPNLSSEPSSSASSSAPAEHGKGKQVPKQTPPSSKKGKKKA